MIKNVPCGRTDWHDENKSFFRNFANAPKNRSVTILYYFDKLKFDCFPYISVKSFQIRIKH